MIQFNKVEKSFGKQKVLHDFDININQPGIYAILGPNGSGKTTIIKTLMGLVHPDSGEIRFMNKKLKGDDYRNHIAYLPQIARFPENLTANEFINFIENIRGKATRRNELIDHFGLKPYLDKRLRNLSGGTRQKVNLVSSLMYDTKVLLLDEPSIGLDPVALLRLKDWIQQERTAGKIILLTTHVMDLVQELADEIVFVLEGKVYYQGDQRSLFEETGTPDLEHAIAYLLTLKKAG